MFIKEKILQYNCQWKTALHKTEEKGEFTEFISIMS